MACGHLPSAHLPDGIDGNVENPQPLSMMLDVSYARTSVY